MFNERNNNSARTSRFFVHFFAVPAKTTPWNDHILSIFGKGNGKAINSTIYVWTRARCLFLRSNPNFLLLSNWAPWNNREKKWCEVCFLETFSWTSPLSDRNVPIKPQRRWDAKKGHFLESKGLRSHWRPWSSCTPTLKPAYIYNMFQCS